MSVYALQPTRAFSSISRIRTQYKDTRRALKMLRIVGGTVARCVRSFTHTHLKRTHTHTHLKHAHTHTSEARAHTHTSEARAHTHIWSARTHTRIWIARTQIDASTLHEYWALLRFFWAWMNKFRQNYIKMHVLANILVNSRLRKA